MKSCIHWLFVDLAILACGLAFASNSSSVSITVKDDGASCLVRGHDTACATLARYLTDELSLTKSTAVAVTPAGCGGVALAQASSIANQLKKAGFTNAYPIGFITAPGRQCSP